jgi:hypothetical protein
MSSLWEREQEAVSPRGCLQKQANEFYCSNAEDVLGSRMIPTIISEISVSLGMDTMPGQTPKGILA